MTWQCCGTGAGTGTAGIATFCLNGTGTKSNKKFEANFLGNKAAFSIEKASFCTNFLLLKKCALKSLDPVLEPEAESGPETESGPKTEPGRKRSRNRNQNFSEVGTRTGTAINNNGSTTPMAEVHKILLILFVLSCLNYFICELLWYVSIKTFWLHPDA